MKIIHLILLISLCVIGLHYHCIEKSLPEPISIKVLTYNILCSFCNPSYDPWDERVNYIADTINRYNPDLIGLQELVTPEEVEQFLQILTDYDAYSFKDYPDSTILWRRSMFSLIDQGHFWLSPTPDLPYSTGFAPSFQLPRLVVWVKLKDNNTGRRFYFFNTHFDNNSPSQDLSAVLVIEKIPVIIGGAPIIFTGDFNSQTYDPAYFTLTQGLSANEFYLIDAYDITPEAESHINTNVSPTPTYSFPDRIDHIFVQNGDFKGIEFLVDLYTYGENQRYPSDHFAVYAQLVLK